MSTEHIIRAWRDEEYREALNAEQSEILPESPIGAIELSDQEMAEAEGGTSLFCVTVITFTIFLHDD
jgi:mersacidin/lichenicidin family type 2 lantibiotic